MLMEGIITLLILAALFYVAPGIFVGVSKASGTIVTSSADVGNATGLCQTSGCGVLGSLAMNQSQASIATTASGALNLSTIGLIMMGIALMIGGFMIIRGYKR
jgi:hypothetical protein